MNSEQWRLWARELATDVGARLAETIGSRRPKFIREVYDLAVALEREATDATEGEP